MSISITKYDPVFDIDPEQWEALDEYQRIELVTEYHREASIELPNERVHAVMHVIIENQIALGDETPVAGTMRRLLGEGLDRHDAIHAIASVLINFMYEKMQGEVDSEVNDAYYAELKQLTAEKWRRGEYTDTADSSRE